MFPQGMKEWDGTTRRAATVGIITLWLLDYCLLTVGCGDYRWLTPIAVSRSLFEVVLCRVAMRRTIDITLPLLCPSALHRVYG